MKSSRDASSSYSTSLLSEKNSDPVKNTKADKNDSRSGDLRANSDPQDVLHTFSLGLDGASDAKGVDSFQLPTRLDLGVGGDGVVGRRVSLVRKTGMGGSRVLRQGIIGWN
jgi:hypothetical protein